MRIMFHKLKKYKSVFVILIISVLFCLDLFIRNGRPSAFDAPTHLTNIAQFTKALRDHDFPVRWMDGFANYGMPMGIIVQQMTSYLGAIFNLLTNNVVLSYNMVVLVGVFFSAYFFYRFLRLHFSENASLLGTILFNFAPYRIINVYVRGALPEFFSHVFFPLILIGLFLWIKKQDKRGLLYLFAGTLGTLLTHPFVMVIGMFVWVPYALWLYFDAKPRPSLSVTFIVPVIVFILLALGISAFYILPLFQEIKYFYYGSAERFLPGQFLTIKNYIGDQWFYFFNNDIDVRGHVIHLGLIEGLIIAGGALYWILSKKKQNFLSWVLASFLLIFFFTTEYANPIYLKIKLLGSIQHNWRMFTSMILIAPLVVAFLQDKLKSMFFFWLILTIIIVTKVPQLYGKNYLIEPQSKYYWTKENLHGNILNTVWTGPTEDYPIKKVKGEIIAGNGQILKRDEHNSWRTYTVEVKDELRMVDNTFYFPGWKVYVDGKPTGIEWQDMNYRGVITYKVPSGSHEVKVVFENTKIRLLGNVISVGSLFLFVLTLLLGKKLLYLFK